MPTRAMAAGECCALLLTVSAPECVPVAEGANVARTVVDCVGLRTSPAAAPLALNPAPATATLEIVTLEVPALVRVIVCSLLLDTLTLPKFRLEGLGFKSNV